MCLSETLPTLEDAVIDAPEALEDELAEALEAA